jgi:uncharacterized coiled-coil protein SlyX
MIRNIYFVDCENVGFQHLIGINNAESRVYYFCKTVQKDFQPDYNEFLLETNHNGCKDALDFIIDSYLGYQIRNFGKGITYTIVSTDQGFINTVNFWKSQGYDTELKSIINMNGSNLLDSTLPLENRQDNQYTASQQYLSTDLTVSDVFADIFHDTDEQDSFDGDTSDPADNADDNAAMSLDPILDLSLDPELIQQVPDTLHPDLYSVNLREQAQTIENMKHQLEEQKKLISQMSKQISVLAKAEAARRKMEEEQRFAIVSYKNLKKGYKQKITNVFNHCLRTRYGDADFLLKNINTLNLAGSNIDKFRLFQDIKNFRTEEELHALLY